MSISIKIVKCLAKIKDFVKKRKADLYLFGLYSGFIYSFNLFHIKTFIPSDPHHDNRFVYYILLDRFTVCLSVY